MRAVVPTMLSKVPRDAVAFGASAFIIAAMVEVIKALAKGPLMKMSPRKLLHVLAGPVFLMTWPWFTDEGRYWAAGVPLVMTLKFALVGLGLLGDDGEVRMMSRGGHRSEILRGPLLYGMVFVAATVLAFRDLTAAVALMALCFGDAAAEVCGKGSTAKLPWSKRKSWAGSAGFFLAALPAMALFAVLFQKWGFAPSDAPFPLLSLALAALAGTAIESLPFRDVDNLSVPFVVATVFKWSYF